MEFIPLTNNFKKFVKSLHLKKNRDDEQLFIAEGNKICFELASCDFKIIAIILKEGYSQTLYDLIEQFAVREIDIFLASENQFTQISDTKTPQDIIAVVEYPNNSINFRQDFVLLDGISDPGNLGTIFRICDWFGFKNVILTNDSADQYNPKVVRSSMGSVFRCNVISIDWFGDFYKQNYKGFRLLGATLNAQNNLSSIDDFSHTGLVFGNESKGISQEILNMLDYEFKIEGTGSAESLNVANAAAISLYYVYLKVRKKF